MILHISRSKNSTLLYVAVSVRNEKGVPCKKIIERLGNVKEIMAAQNLDSEEACIDWAKEYIAKKNQEAKTENAEIKVSIYPNKKQKIGYDNKMHIGYLFLQKIYHTIGINLICDAIKKKHRATYDLNHIMESLLYARMINPVSKLRTCDEVSRYYKWGKIESHQVYRALSIFAKESKYIQSQLFLNSKKVIDRDTTILYYDCSNFYFEVEQASGLRQYGVSKEHRPNPIVEIGLFMDAKGYPLGFCVDKGNTSETKTMIPLEKEIIERYSLSEFIVCTDSAMAISANKSFNSINDKHFVTVQSIKKLSSQYQEIALSAKGWKKYVVISDSDTEDEKRRKRTEISKKILYDIDKIDEEKEYDTIFYKKIGFKQEIKDDNGKSIIVDQYLYITYSVKYKRYLRRKRSEHIKKAEEAINRGDKITSSRDYKRLISKVSCTKEGEEAVYTTYYIDENTIAEEEKYDGLYGVSTDLDKGGLSKVININKNRWEIEESFRILKTDLQARPIYLSRDDRIEAHLLTCYLTLFLHRFLEKNVLNEIYTTTEIIETIRDMEAIKFGNGIIPAFKNSPCAHAIQTHLNTTISYEYITENKLDALIKKNKKNSDKVKRLFETGKKPVGRPSKGTKKVDEESND